MDYVALLVVMVSYPNTTFVTLVFPVLDAVKFRMFHSVVVFMESFGHKENPYLLSRFLNASSPPSRISQTCSRIP